MGYQECSFWLVINAHLACQVVEVAAIYENKITLRVENKVIGHGELVIVNDRYGVKVTDIAQNKNITTGTPVGENSVPENASTVLPDEIEQNSAEIEQEHQQAQPETVEDAGEEEFDYSDFELEDEDI